jgi:uncharacterized membrane protein YccC
MHATLKHAIAIAIVVAGTLGLLLGAEILPYGDLWLVTLVASGIAYWVCTSTGWLALVLIPFFPFLIFVLEMDPGYGENRSFGIAIAAWLVFALSALAGARRWRKRLRESEPGTK